MRKSVITILCFILYASMMSYALAQNNSKAREQRDFNAKQQLRDYNKLQSLETFKQQKYKGFTSSQRIGIFVSDNLKTNSTIFFYDDFETTVNNWTTTGYLGSDLWHRTNVDAASPTTSYWCGIEDSGNYNTGERLLNALISPSINLINANAPVHLLFAEKYETEKGWDYCMVDISTDNGSSWIHLRGGYGSAPNGSSDGWLLTLLDLSPYIGHEIMIRFLFDTGDDLVNYFPGWFIDDLIIYDNGGLITGKKFFDFNQNSIKDIEDKGIKDWLITATGNGITITTKTNIRGRYQIPLPMGNYIISEEHKPNWTQTCPLTGDYDIQITTPDTLIDSLHFGNYTQASTISGVKFSDINQNFQMDEEDTLIVGWKVWLYKCDEITGCYEIDYDRTDSLGSYNFFVLEPGNYMIEEVSKYGWIQTYPVGITQEETYRVELSNLDTVVLGLDFGNYGSTLQNFVSGYKFFDANRNGIRDSSEIGLSDFKIKLMKLTGNQFANYRQTTTDSNGYYEFRNIPPNVYKVIEVPKIGWWQSYPDSFYIVDMISEVDFDTLDFGNYQIGFGSVSGVLFNDINDNGIKDGDETGLAGWNVVLEGNTYYNTFVSQSTITNSEGEYIIDNLLPGNYTINQILKPNWRQTYPEGLHSHFIVLAPEEIRTNLNFGSIYDSTQDLAFTSFIPDSFALAYKLIKPRPDKIYWQTKWIKPSDFFVTDSIKSIKIMLIRPPIENSLSVSKNCSIGIDLKLISIIFEEYLKPDDSVMISGLSIKTKPQATKWIMFMYDDSMGVKRKVDLIEYYESRYPMPNAVNVLAAGAGSNLMIGVGGPHTVLHRNYVDVMKSLVEKSRRMHIGDARCLDKFTNGISIKKQQSRLTPTKGNNKLFAEAIALKANIKASDLGITPPGFGSLIFNEGGSSQLNGMSIRGIATTLDLYMSSYDDFSSTPSCVMPPIWNGLDPETLYTKIRMINNAFCGPIDTISFATGLRLKPFKKLTEVPFLKLDSSYNYSAILFNEDKELEPDKFILMQNYPNPFNPSTTVEFYLPEDAAVTLELYNVLGQKIAIVLNKQIFEEGWNEIEISANSLNLASGIYYYKFLVSSLSREGSNQVKEYSEIRKMIYLK